jgi:hypothetical protein
MFIIISNKGSSNQNDTEIPPHPSQNGYYQENEQQQMLVMMKLKRNPDYTPLVVM